jgi:hypothetical protein
MFDTDNWNKVVEFHHKDVRAKVYQNVGSDLWKYEYESGGCANVGAAATAEVAMQRIEDYIRAGIAIRERVKA